jgi:hypothetical protein
MKEYKIQRQFKEYRVMSRNNAFLDIYGYLVQTKKSSIYRVFQICFFCQLIYVTRYKRWLFECGEEFRYPEAFSDVIRNADTNHSPNPDLIIYNPLKKEIIDSVYQTYENLDLKTVDRLIQFEIQNIQTLSIYNIIRYYKINQIF